MDGKDPGVLFLEFFEKHNSTRRIADLRSHYPQMQQRLVLECTGIVLSGERFFDGGTGLVLLRRYFVVCDGGMSGV